ncbi:nickel pincer cofactor biosynthesis protein LarB, partial [Sutterella sp.]|uniref:nickel pincer cofactor biosynthesis protein LarB n=1 Tax=Sutterella sp. TaxID=1981025 RepID=UPI0026E0A688
MIESTVRFDLERERRIGLPEAVFCAGKPFPVLEGLFERFAADDAPAILFTRLEPEVFARLSPETAARYDFDPVSRTAWNACRGPRPGTCALVSAGNADASVLHEAARTLTYLGYTPRLFEDCGVAGLWRIEAAITDINACDVVILAAGLDAALASVVGGLTMKPLFAVPTSVGYGIATGGETALRSMLASCAPGVGVMNIDNGYGAACAAA